MSDRKVWLQFVQTDGKRTLLDYWTILEISEGEEEKTLFIVFENKTFSKVKGTLEEFLEMIKHL